MIFYKKTVSLRVGGFFSTVSPSDFYTERNKEWNEKELWKRKETN